MGHRHSEHVTEPGRSRFQDTLELLLAEVEDLVVRLGGLLETRCRVDLDKPKVSRAASRLEAAGYVPRTTEFVDADIHFGASTGIADVGRVDGLDSLGGHRQELRPRGGWWSAAPMWT